MAPRAKKPVHVLCVFGTRPEAIKMAPLVLQLRKRPSDFKTTVVVTAQHRRMLDQVLDLFGVKSDYDLDLMKKDQTLEHIITEVLTQLGPILDDEKPDMVLVHGDTTTTFAATLSAYYHQIPVGHVEAGLRSYDHANPFPEESNRLLADHLCTLHFAPTHQARENLLKENISPKGIFVTGNTVTDALFIAIAAKHKWEDATLQALFDPGHKSGLSRPGQRLILVTAHRRENHGAPLERVFKGLRRAVDEHADVSVVYPVHLNPIVQKSAQAILSKHPRIHLIPPIHYMDMVHLMEKSHLVVTDSGGIQEEAPALGKPVLVLRKVTERPEAVAAGTAAIVGVEENGVYARISELLRNKKSYERMANAVNPYGDGKASVRILDAMRYHFGTRNERPAEFKGDRTVHAPR